MEPEDSLAYGVKAEILVKLGRHEEAERYYDKAERLKRL